MISVKFADVTDHIVDTYASSALNYNESSDNIPPYKAVLNYDQAFNYFTSDTGQYFPGNIYQEFVNATFAVVVFKNFGVNTENLRGFVETNIDLIRNAGEHRLIKNLQCKCMEDYFSWLPRYKKYIEQYFDDNPNSLLNSSKIDGYYFRYPIEITLYRSQEFSSEDNIQHICVSQADTGFLVRKDLTWEHLSRSFLDENNIVFVTDLVEHLRCSRRLEEKYIFKCYFNKILSKTDVEVVVNSYIDHLNNLDESYLFSFFKGGIAKFEYNNFNTILK